MTEILPTASYLRCADRLDPRTAQSVLYSLCQRHGFKPPEASLRIWQLLETPQTVTTICRILAREYDVPTQMCDPSVRSFLADLYREDLIQVSPDT